MLELKKVSKALGSFLLGPVDLKLERGIYAALVGPNGAGKTTLQYLIAGFIHQDSGEIMFEGHDIGSLPTDKRSAAFVFSEPALFPNMTIEENLSFACRNEKARDELINLFSLKSMLRKKSSQLSAGEARIVEIARAILSEPSILLLDEPFAPLDAKNRKEISGYLKEYTEKRRICTLISAHSESELDGVDYVFHITNGKLQRSAI
ncbi:MAG: ATP-binding cassette domain-containing protein [Conexivisphaerales archaeon]